MLPEFEKAATEMPANQRAVFAKLDVLQNDGEVGSGITYPTLVLHFPGGDRVIYKKRCHSDSFFFSFLRFPTLKRAVHKDLPTTFNGC